MVGSALNETSGLSAAQIKGKSTTHESMGQWRAAAPAVEKAAVLDTNTAAHSV